MLFASKYLLDQREERGSGEAQTSPYRRPLVFGGRWMTRRWVQCIPLILSAVACGLPRDSAGTLDRVRRGSMRVGVVVDTPWTTDSVGGAGGVEPALVRSLADSLGTRIEWVRGPEGELLSQLEKRKVDLVIGGLDAK